MYEREIPQPPGMVACRHPLSLSLFLCRPLFPSLVLSLSLSLSLSLTFSFCLALSRALAHALGLVTSRVLEDTIDTPTFSNGVDNFVLKREQTTTGATGATAGSHGGDTAAGLGKP